jgi:hypothetical protein
VTNRVLVDANGLETKNYRSGIAPFENKVLIRIGWIGPLKSDFKLWIVMAVDPPLKGTPLLGMRGKRHVLGIGKREDSAGGPAVRFRLAWHNDLALERSYAVEIGPGG